MVWIRDVYQQFQQGCSSGLVNINNHSLWLNACDDNILHIIINSFDPIQTTQLQRVVFNTENDFNNL